MILRLALFLLLVSSPVYGLTVPLYGTYDFNTKLFTVFWNLPTSYASYKIKFYNLEYLGDCPNLTEKLTLINTYVAPVTSKSFNVPNVVHTKTYKAEIYGVNGTSENIIASQLFWIYAISPRFEVTWCMDVSSISTYSWTGYYLYRADNPSFNFTSYEVLDDWKKKLFDKTLVYGTKTNFILTSAAKLTPTSNVTESPGSAQLLTYSVIPAKPVWIGLGK